MKIGILETGHVAEPLLEKHGNYASMFETLLDGFGFDFENFAVVDGRFPQSIHECDGWLITGSRHGVYEQHAFIAPLETFIQQVYEAGVPIAGICFGHQIMAQALGGKVEKFSGGWSVGHTIYNTPDGERAVLAMHQDQVTKKPDDTVVIASTDFCKYAGLAYKGQAISFQPHPEFTVDYMQELIKYRMGNGLPEETAASALEKLKAENDSLEIAGQLAEFFKSALVRV